MIWAHGTPFYRWTAMALSLRRYPVSEEIPASIYKRLINTINDGILVIRPDGKIELANTAMEAITGYPRSELLRSTCAVLNCDVCEIVRSKGKRHWCGLFEYGKANRKHCIIERKDGSYAAIIKTAMLIKDDQGRLFGAMEIFTDLSELTQREQEIRDLSTLLMGDKGYHGIVGRSAVMQQIYQTIEKVAGCDAPVIITGETGTGKDLVARAIHAIGRRKEGPYIQFNCAALNESLCESELFGHVKGAFTGAHRHRKGRFECAHGGDIFLDEIGEISPSVQAKLLRVLETKQFERVGDSKSLCVDARIIAATNKDLQGLIGSGAFREDLFYRINVVPLHLPPLRERMEDLPLLVKTFLNDLSHKHHPVAARISPEVMDLFMRYAWPGNIRELKSALEYASILSGEDQIQSRHLPEQIKKFVGGRATPEPARNEAGPSSEKAALLDALRQCKGNKTKAACILGVHRMTVWNRIKKYGIQSRHVID